MTPTLDDVLFSRLSQTKIEVRSTALVELRRQFLSGDIDANYLDNPHLLAAYEWFFFPQSLAKAASVLNEIGWSPAADAVVWDLGSAMGPLAFAAWQRQPSARLFLLDRSERALNEAQQLAQAVRAKMTTEMGDVLGALPTWPRADLIVIGNALAEIAIEQQQQLIERLLKNHLTPTGTLVIIEPADRDHARALQALRDSLLVHGRVPVAPCPHDSACPASIRPRDFCHQARHLPLPTWFDDARQVAGLSDTRLRFSYLVYQPNASLTHAPNLVRIISHRISEKGRQRFFGCSDQGLVEIMRQDRLKSPANAAIDRLGRGALIRLPHLAKLTKLKAEDVVEVVGEPDPWAAGE